MSRLIVDPATGEKLRGQLSQVELCDAEGRVLGVFTPQIDASLYEGLEPQISEEELRRREQETGGRTLAEILADLEKRS